MGNPLVIIGVGLLVFLAHLFASLFEKTRVPDVLPLVFLGLVVGPLFGLIPPEAFGKVGATFATLTLIVILFESGLWLKLSELTAALKDAGRLTFANFAGTVLLCSFGARHLIGLNWVEGALLGAILGGTSSAVVIPMVERLPVSEKPRTALILESTFSDVLCIVVTLALLSSIRYGELRPGLMLGQVIASFVLAALLGHAGGLFWSTVLDKVRKLENSIFTTPAFVLILFGTAELLGYSGAIAALSFGVTLGNPQLFETPLLRNVISFRPVNLKEAEKAFFNDIVFLFKSFFFVYIGLSIPLNDLWRFGGGFVLAAGLTAMRFGVVRLALPPDATRSEALTAAVLNPKGLAAAVLAGMPLGAGLESGAAIQDLVYSTVLFSILFSAALVFAAERGRLDRLAAVVFPGYAADPPPTSAAPTA